MFTRSFKSSKLLHITSTLYWKEVFEQVQVIMFCWIYRPQTKKEAYATENPCMFRKDKEVEIVFKKSYGSLVCYILLVSIWQFIVFFFKYQSRKTKRQPGKVMKSKRYSLLMTRIIHSEFVF